MFDYQIMENLLSVSLVVLYFGLLLFIGIRSSRKISNTADYIVAGRKLGFWVFVFLMVGSTASGMTLLGVSGLGYIGGWPTFWEQLFVPLSSSACLILFGVKLSRLAEKRDYMTLEDYFCERYYSNHSMRVLSSVFVLFVSFVYLVGQYTAISIVLQWLLNLNHVTSLIVSALIIMAYVVLGGMYAVAFTTILQSAMIIAGVIVLCPMIIAKIPQFNSVIGSIDPDMVHAFYPQMHPPKAAYAFATPAFIASFSLFLTFGLASAPHIINNVLAVKKKQFFKWAPLLVFAIYFVVMALIKVSGFAVRALDHQGVLSVDKPDFAFIAGIEFVLAKYLWVFVGTVILAAVMSTTDRLLLTIGNCVSWDLYKKYIRPDADDRHIQRVNRIAVMVATVLTVTLAINPPKLLAFLIWVGIGVMFSCFLVPLPGGLYWRRGTKEASIATMSVGFVGAIVSGAVHFFYYKLPVHFSVISFGAAALTFAVVSLMTRKPDDAVLDVTETGMYITEKCSPDNTEGGQNVARKPAEQMQPVS
ncbi:MAG: sodium:solute symporter [Chitinispirillaceae bacterium]